MHDFLLDSDMSFLAVFDFEISLSHNRNYQSQLSAVNGSAFVARRDGM
jgi:hypothetical protein